MRKNYESKNGNYNNLTEKELLWLKKNEKKLPQIDFKKNFGEDKVLYFEEIKLEEDGKLRNVAFYKSNIFDIVNINNIFIF